MTVCWKDATRSSVAGGVTASHWSSLGPRALAQQFAPRLDFGLHVPLLHPAQHRRLQSAETEIERVAFHSRERELHGPRIAVRRQRSITGPPG